MPLEKNSGQKDAPTEVAESRPPIELAFINATIHQLHPSLSQLTVGNISVDYGRDTFSPVFGFKGVEAEGTLQPVPVHFDAFAIKHAFDSFTFGFMPNSGSGSCALALMDQTRAEVTTSTERIRVMVTIGLLAL